MSKIHDIKNKIRVLNTKGSNQLIVDILRYIDDLSGSSGDMSMKEYVENAVRISDYLRGKYDRELKEQPKKQKVYQKTLDQEISDYEQNNKT